MSKSFKILLVLLTVSAAYSVFLMGKYFYDLHHGPSVDVALIVRDNGEFNFAGKSGTPVCRVQILRKPDSSVTWTLSSMSEGAAGMSNIKTGGNAEREDSSFSIRSPPLFGTQIPSNSDGFQRTVIASIGHGEPFARMASRSLHQLLQESSNSRMFLRHSGTK